LGKKHFLYSQKDLCWQLEEEAENGGIRIGLFSFDYEKTIAINKMNK
jgi:hypothetical protein